MAFDPSTAKPVFDPSTAKEIAEPEGFFGASVIEPIMTLGSGIVAEPAAGITGLATTLLTGNPEAGASVVEDVRNKLTYQPSTQKGQAGLEAIGSSAPIQMLGQGLQAAEQFSGDVGYSAGEAIGGKKGAAIGGAIGATLPTAIMESLGLIGASKVRGVKKLSGIPDDIIDDLAKKGIDIDDLSDQGIAKIHGAVAERTAEEVKRLKAFEAEGIPTLQSRVSQRFGDFLSERKLKRADTPEGQALRRRATEESAGFQDAVNRYQSAFGLSDEAGDSIKEALKARESGLKADVKSAYESLNETTKGRGFPLVGNKITEALDDPAIQAFAGRLSKGDRAKVNDILIEYGLDTDADRVTDWIARREAESGSLPIKTEITPLNLNNFEEMRQAFSGLSSPDAPAELRGSLAS
jgi:hypothetical protein